jgi:hypothetical protein
LRWINAGRAQSVQTNAMDRFTKLQLLAAASRAQPDTVRRQMSVPAAWPAGVSQLAQTVNACQRRGANDVDWLARASNSIVPASEFRPNGRAFAR